MNQSEQLEFARYKLVKRAQALEAEIDSLCESVTSALNQYVYPHAELKVTRAAELMRRLQEVHGEYQGIQAKLAELGA